MPPLVRSRAPRRTLLRLSIALLTLLLTSMVAVSADEAADAPELEPITVGDPAVPTDELKLLLVPLTKDELIVEADAWQALVQEKAEEIARAEIAVKRQNKEIEQTKEVEAKAKDATKQLEKVTAAVEEAKESGDAAAIAEAEEAADEAREQVAEVAESVQEAQEAAERTEEMMQDTDSAAAEDLDATADASAKEEAMAATGAAMDATQGAKRAEKSALLETVNQLREERVVLVDNLRAVIEALDVKTAEEDSTTKALIKDYRLYISAISGLTVDVEDAASAWSALSGWAMSEEGGLRWAKNIAMFLGILIVARILAGIASGAVGRGLRKLDVPTLLRDFLSGAVYWVIMIGGLLMALSALEVSMGPLLAMVGAAGFIVAFAMQDSLSNFASGLMILFFRPFDTGDVVEAGGVSGTVESMNLVATTVKTFDNKRMIVPNNKIIGDVITNATGVPTRRVDMEFGIGYDDDIDRAQEILTEIVANHPQVLSDPAPTIRLNTLADSSVNFIVRPWSRTPDYWGVYWDITREVKRRFDAAGIGIPYPQQDVHLHIVDKEAAQKALGHPDMAPTESKPVQQPMDSGE
jgi:small conductance mechanosensitive channel